MGMGKVAAGQHCAGVVLPHNCSKQEEEECGGLQCPEAGGSRHLSKPDDYIVQFTSPLIVLLIALML